MRNLFLVLALFATPAGAQEHKPIRPATVEEQGARAAVTIADYRFDDLLWENDRIAFRIYGRALEAAEPPSSSGIDAWGKRVRWPYMDRQLRTGDQHADHGEGVDFYNVGTGRGAGAVTRGLVGSTGWNRESPCWRWLAAGTGRSATNGMSSSCGSSG